MSAMPATIEVSPDEAARRRRVRGWLLVSLAFLVAGVVAQYLVGGVDQRVAPFFGAVMLWLVYRRHSRVARGIAFVLPATGAVAALLVSVFSSTWSDGALLAMFGVIYAGQAAPLVVPAVRDHVQVHRPPRRSNQLAYVRGRFVEPTDEPAPVQRRRS